MSNAAITSKPQAALGWAVAMTHPHKEKFAAENLKRQNFVVYQPVILKRVTHARSVQHLPRALFPGYLFVQNRADAAEWRAMSGTFGIRSVIRIGGRPAVLPDRFVTELQNREIEGVIARPAIPLKPGDMIRINRGPFEGTITKILSVSASDRVAVLLELLSREVVAHFEVDNVTPFQASA